MITYNILAGSTDVSVVIRIIDSADGTPETAVVFNTSGIDLEYRRELAASVDITEATLAALTTAHADGGFLHIGNGYYRLDLPDAAVAAGASGVLVHGVVTGMVVIGCYINLTPVPVDVRQYGGTAGTFSGGRPEVNTTHAAGTAWNSGGIGPNTLASDTLTAAKVASDVGTEIGTAVWATTTRILTALDEDTTTLDLDATIRAAVGLASANLDTQVADLPTNAELATALGTADDAVLAAVATLQTTANGIDAKTTNLPSDPADASVIAARFDTLDTSVADLPTNAELATALGTADDAVLTAINDLPTNAELATALGTADDAVLAQIALVKAKTDSLTFTVAGQADVNVQSVNDVALIGDGSATPWGPAP